MPYHKVYLEPFFGSGAVFFKKTPSKVETINDIDGQVVNLFKVIREQPEKLARLIYFTPWARDEYLDSYNLTGDSLEDARRFIVRCWQAFGTKTNTRSGWRSDVQGKRGTTVTKQWNNVPESIIQAAERLRNAQIENQPAIEIIRRYKSPDVLIYADPPYPLSTKSGKMYAYEMTNDEHLELLKILDQHPGPVIISSYSCDMYDNQLKNWTKKTKRVLAECGQVREEAIWINRNIDQGLFKEV